MILTVCSAGYFIWYRNKRKLDASVASKPETKVTQTSANKTASKKVSKVSKPVRVRKEPTNRFVKTLFAIGGYFKGAWTELRQVRWPTRRATWGLTLAVILFSAFFAIIILLLDILFKYLFEIILK
jgi:preprotein translocase SecE subunit